MADTDNLTTPTTPTTGASDPTHDADAAPVGFHPPLRPPVATTPRPAFVNDATGYTGEDGG